VTRILFLDVDGVVNSTKTCVAFGGYPHDIRPQDLPMFDTAAIALLQRLCDSAGIQVVLSSAWRLSHDFKAVGEAFGLPIIDRTPALPGPRGEEIAFWLHQHPEVTQYAILDDDPDMLEEQKGRFVRTNGREGLTWEAFEALCELFGENPYAGEPRKRNWRDVKLAWEV
jgi:hypothetical protein